MRWYERFEQIHNGFDKRGFENKKDDILAFFMNCFHLKDWIRYDTDIPYQEVENFVNENDCLKYCADIANGSKHLSLSRRRKTSESDILRTAVIIDKEKQQAIPLLIIWDSQGNIKDTFEIATEAVEKWREFFRKYELFE